MQFDVMKDSNLSQGELAKIAIEGGEGNYNYYPLIGGGSLLVLNQKQSNKKVIEIRHVYSNMNDNIPKNDALTVVRRFPYHRRKLLG